MKLKDKVAIVTGAGSGIGRAIAERLAEEGSAVVVAEINPDDGKSVVKTLLSRERQASFVRTDVAQEADVRAMIKAAVAAHGRLDILINNAGVNFVKPFLETTLADWERVIRIDLRGTFLGCRDAIEQFIAQGEGGCIVNISSVHAAATLPGAVSHAAAKGGVTALTRGPGYRVRPAGHFGSNLEKRERPWMGAIFLTYETNNYHCPQPIL